MAALFSSPSGGIDSDEQQIIAMNAEKRARDEADRQRALNEEASARQLAAERKAAAEAAAEAEAKALAKEQEEKAKKAAEIETENIKKKKGGASATIATGPEGILDDAPTSVRTLLG